MFIFTLPIRFLLALLLFTNGILFANGQTSYRKFTFVNNCTATIYVGAQGNPLPANGGWKMGPGETKLFYFSAYSTAMRFWPRTNCNLDNYGHLVCATGDCPLPWDRYNSANDGTMCAGIGGKPPASLIELTLGGPGGNDFYDISLVDGVTIPVSIKPENGKLNPNMPSTSPFNCGTPGCPAFDFNKCPSELKMTASTVTNNACTGTSTTSTNVVACMNICTAVNDPVQRAKYPILQTIWNSYNATTGYPIRDLVCCACGDGKGGCDNPASEFCCNPFSAPNPYEKGGKCYLQNWPVSSIGMKYPDVFKSQCPSAYSWQFDDSSSTYQCIGADYRVTFC